MKDSRTHEAPEVVPAVPTFTPLNLTIASFGVAFLFLAAILILNKRRNKSRGSSLILVGPPDAGKTSILSSLVYGQTLPTHSSIQTNTAAITLPKSNKSILVVDIPGHPRVRNQFQEHLPDAKAVVFVVDASTISRNGPAVAEHLHHILHALTSLPPSQFQPSLLIAAHKADLLKSATSSSSASLNTMAITRVKTVLERELEKRRVSQTGGVGIEGLGAEGDRSELGGLECGENAVAFKFDDWEGGDIIFTGTSINEEKVVNEEKEGSGDGLTMLLDWVDQII